MMTMIKVTKNIWGKFKPKIQSFKELFMPEPSAMYEKQKALDSIRNQSIDMYEKQKALASIRNQAIDSQKRALYAKWGAAFSSIDGSGSTSTINGEKVEKETKKFFPVRCIKCEKEISNAYFEAYANQEITPGHVLIYCKRCKSVKKLKE